MIKLLVCALTVALLPSSLATTVRVGQLVPLYTPIALLRQQWGNAWGGLYAAFAEANRTRALGDDTIRLYAKDVVTSVSPGSVVASVQSLIYTDQVQLFSYNSYFGILDWWSNAAPLGIPLIGCLSPEAKILYSPQSTVAINFRVAFGAELMQMANYAMNSEMHCQRFAVMWLVTPTVKVMLDEFLAALTGPLGFTQDDVFDVPLEQAPPSWYPYVDSLLRGRPHCVLFLNTPDALPPALQAARSHPLFDPDIRWFGTSAVNLAKFPPIPNLYIMQQFPDPTDVSYIVVQKYQAAMTAAFAEGFDRPINFTTGPWVDTTPSYSALEGYIVGRLTVEILRRAPDYTRADIVNSVYANKMYTVDDLILGPYADGCVGHEADLALPCFCNSASKFIYTSKVSLIDGAPHGIADDASLGEKGVATSQVPFTRCTLTGNDVFRPYLFLQLVDTSRFDANQPRRVAFNQGLRASVNALRLSGMLTGSNIAMHNVTLDFRGLDLTQLVVNKTFRYAPLAIIGTSGIPSSALNAAPNATQPAYIGDYQVTMALTDPPAANFNKGTVDFFPVLADHVHTLAAYYAATATTAPGVTVLATSSEEASLGVKSLNTFQIQPQVTVTTTAPPAQVGGSTLLITQNVGFLVDVLTAVATTKTQVASPEPLLVATSEEALYDALQACGAVVASSQVPILFASNMKAFWNVNTTATVASASTLTELYNAALSPTVSPHPAAVRAFRLAALMMQVANGLKPISSANFISSLYSRQTTTVLDASMGPVFATACSTDAMAQTPNRQCQCAKGPHRFFVQSVLEWARSNATAGVMVSSEPRFTYAMLTCGVQYGPLLDTSDKSAFIVGLTVGISVFVILIAAAQVAYLTSKQRATNTAPKDAERPFAIVFTDIQSSTALWARIPGVMAKAVDVHHETIRATLRRHNGYEVKTIGDSFMVAFIDVRDAVNFAVDVQLELAQLDWQTCDIDRTYADLAHEKSMDAAVETKGVDAEQFLDKDVWNGLRVRIGVHYGCGSIKFDDVTQGYDYYGTVVNTAARVEGVGHGGQILLSEAAHAALVGQTSPDVIVTDLGPQPLRGLDEPLRLYQVTPESLKRRTFGALRLEVDGFVDGLEKEYSTESDAATHLTNTTDGNLVAPAAWRYAERVNRTKPQDAYEAAMCNFVFLRALLSAGGEKAAKSTMESLLQRWHVKSQKPRGVVSKTAVMEYNMMQLAIKATPAAEALKKDYFAAVLRSGGPTRRRSLQQDNGLPSSPLSNSSTTQGVQPLTALHTLPPPIEDCRDC